MSRGIRDHVVRRAFTPNGTIARTTVEQLPNAKGATVTDVQPIALAFIRAAHDSRCGCHYCKL